MTAASALAAATPVMFGVGLAAVVANIQRAVGFDALSGRHEAGRRLDFLLPAAGPGTPYSGMRRL